MKFIADLHIHSKYSRAVSKDMVLEELDRWADDKGILVMGTGDFTHPAWFKEIQQKLEPAESGLFKLKNHLKRKTIKDTFAETRFLLTVEISCIYKRGGRVRRAHHIILAPDLETVKKINTHLSWTGNLQSDGRPILGMDSEELLKIVLNANPEAALIPAHCLLPDAVVHTQDDLLKPIQDIKKGDLVITHQNRWRRVKEIFKRPYHGKAYHIKPRNLSLGLMTTSEHPFYAIRTHKNCHGSGGICKPSHQYLNRCRSKYFRNYKPQWLMASQLECGDILIFPRFKNLFKNHKMIDLQEIVSNSNFDIKVDTKQELIVPIGNKVTAIKHKIIVDKNFCRLVGYYLAKGYTNSRDLIGFAFNKKESKYIEEVIRLMKIVFGFDKEPKLRIDKSGGVEILFYSKILCETFRRLFYAPGKIPHANNKTLPDWALGLAEDLQAEIVRGWWRGDAGYTTSRLLMNQMKIIFLRLGIVPSIYFDSPEKYNARTSHFIKKRKIIANHGLYSLNRLTFFEDKFGLLNEPEFFKVAQYNCGAKYGWMDDQYVYLPIYDIQIKDYRGEVYNLEVEEDNSYVAEFATVHNCWTPWFSVFGSMSGFDSLEECFGDNAKHIFAIETGLSSDPAMNWRLSKLDNISLISNSDSHSLGRIGREANVFEAELSYRGIIEAIKSNNPEKFAMTIEFFPEEGKYHYDGHRVCGIVWEPMETKKNSGLCSVCKKSVTVGVMSRVDQLADRPVGFKDGRRVPFVNLVMLDQVIGEALNLGPQTKAVKKEYDVLIKTFNSELNVLLNIAPRDLAVVTKPAIVEGIERMRAGKLKIRPGYDGEYGEVKIFNDEDRKKINSQNSLF